MSTLPTVACPDAEAETEINTLRAENERLREQQQQEANAQRAEHLAGALYETKHTALVKAARAMIEHYEGCRDDSPKLRAAAVHGLRAALKGEP